MRTPTLAAVVLVLLIVGPNPGRASGTPELRFQFAFLRQDVKGLGLSNDWEADWPRLQAAAGDPLLRLDERDVAAYDAENLRIVLRPAVTPRLLAAVQALPGYLPAWLRKLTALYSTDELNTVLDERGFVVSLDGQPLYGGIVLLTGAERAISYPTLNATVDGDRHIVLQLSFPALAIPVEAGEVEPYERLLRDPRIQKLFAARGMPAQPPSLPKAPAKRVAASIPLNVMPWNAEGRLRLYFRPASREKIAEIRCRLADRPDSPWIVADSDLQVDLGRLYPGKYRFEVEVFDFDGKALGTYTFPYLFDPQAEELRSLKKDFAEAANAWVTLDLEDGKEGVLHFTTLVVAKAVLREIRYSLDSCVLDRRFPLSKPPAADKYFERVPETVRFACVQLVYRDGETTEPRRFSDHPPPAEPLSLAPEPAVAESPAAPSGPARVTLLAQRSNSGWELIFQIADRHAVRDIRYRLAPDSEWRSTGPDPEINLLTGLRSPSTVLAVDPLRVTPGRHRIDVKLVDWKGGSSGPYALWFDPAAEVLRDAKEQLSSGEVSWAYFSDHLGQAQVFFPLTYKDAFREIRYSFDTCDLDQKFPFDPWTDLTLPPEMTEKKGYADMPAKASFICVQLVFRDGEVTEARRFEPDK
ncbi:MAG TPA: hypothetical protein VGS07_33095 [Thermoanaerobaculia bacterium]|jgi:hypothetical protein|nr:hypothetical protein [Thermoanaerobaculia bacterium]